MKKMKRFMLTPDWVLNNLPQSYNIIDEGIAIITEIELDFVLIRQALQTLSIQYCVDKFEIEGGITYVIIIQINDVSQVLSQILRKLKHTNSILRRNFVSVPETGEVLSALFMLSISLGPNVSKINNESHHIDEILSSLSELLVSRCKFLLDSDGSLCYNFKDQDEKFQESEESGLLLMIGALACFQINLGYLELRNPKLKGLNETLSKTFPEIYDAYIDLSKKFGFKGTARLLTTQSINNKRIQKYLRNPGIDEWDSDLFELDENYLEEETSDVSSNNSPSVRRVDLVPPSEDKIAG